MPLRRWYSVGQGEMTSRKPKPFFSSSSVMARLELLHVVRSPPRDVDRARGVEQMRQIPVRFERGERRGRCRCRVGRRRRGLAACHRVDQVVDAHDLDIEVAPRGVDQVIAADRGQVAIAGVDHHRQLGVREFEPGGERNRAAVRGVERIELRVSGDASRAADAANDRNLAGVELRCFEPSCEAVDCSSDAASRTPDVRHALAAEELLGRVLDDGQFADRGAHARTPFSMAARIASGL